MVGVWFLEVKERIPIYLLVLVFLLIVPLASFQHHATVKATIYRDSILLDFDKIFLLFDSWLKLTGVIKTLIVDVSGWVHLIRKILGMMNVRAREPTQWRMIWEQKSSVLLPTHNLLCLLYDFYRLKMLILTLNI